MVARHPLVQTCRYSVVEDIELFTRTDISLGRVRIIAGNTVELKTYIEVLGATWVDRIIVGEVGRMNVMNFAQAYLPEGKEILYMDDDLTGVYREGSDDKKETMTIVLERTAFITEGFAEMRRVGASLWGVYPCYNPIFVKRKPISHDLSFICGAFFSTVNHQSSDMMATMNEGEDFERLFKAYLIDETVVRFN